MLVARGQHVRDAPCPVRDVEVVSDQVWVRRVVHPVVRRDQESAFRIRAPGQLVGLDLPVPAERGVAGRDGHRAVARSAHGIHAGAGVPDRALDVGVDEVLAGTRHPPHRVAELLERRGRGHTERERGLDRVLEPGPCQRERRAGGLGGLDRHVLDLALAERERVEEGTVRRHPHPQLDRLLAPHLDRLVVQHEGGPCLPPPHGGAVVGELLDEQVLDVARHVGRAPRVMRRRTEHDSGRPRQGHATGAIARRRQVHLDPHAGLHGVEMRVVREQRAPGARARGCDDPLVGAASPGPPEGVEQRAVHGSGRKELRILRQGRHQPRDLVEPCPSGDPRSKQLAVSVARQCPR